MERNEANIWTPNTARHNASGLRYKLYRCAADKFSIIPGGKQYRFKAERDDCGLGCKCGAFITQTSEAGRKALAKAVLIDSQSNEVSKDVTP